MGDRLGTQGAVGILLTHFGTFLIFAFFRKKGFHVYVVKLKVYYIKVFYKRDFILQFLRSKKSLILGLSMVFRMAKQKVYPASFTYLLLLLKGSEFSMTCLFFAKFSEM